MLGCDLGTLFKVTVAGGSYQEGLTVHLQGVPPGLLITEEEIYRELLLRKPGQGELSSPRREPDVPVIYSGVNCADTMTGFHNAQHTNGTPMVILIPSPGNGRTERPTSSHLAAKADVPSSNASQMKFASVSAGRTPRSSSP